MSDTRGVVFKTEHLGISFGGLKAVSDFNMEPSDSECSPYLPQPATPSDK